MNFKEKRVKKDIELLKKNNCIFEIIDENNIIFDLVGPKESLYENLKLRINIEIPKEYPYKSPSVGFDTKIYHPNVDLYSGSICLDVLNKKWSPIYSLFNIYTIFIPQLLMYPNPNDPLNKEAACLMKNNIDLFKKKILEQNKKNKN